MVLVQIYITTSNNNTYFPLPFSGTCSIQVLGIQYHSTITNAVQIVQLQSDMLLLPYSPLRYITIMSNAQANFSIDNSTLGYHFKDVYVRGQILINVINYSTGAQPTGFTELILNLDVEEMDSRP